MIMICILALQPGRIGVLNYDALGIKYLKHITDLTNVWILSVTMVIIPGRCVLQHFYTVFLFKKVVGLAERILFVLYWGTVTPLEAGLQSKIIESNPKLSTASPEDDKK